MRLLITLSSCAGVSEAYGGRMERIVKTGAYNLPPKERCNCPTSRNAITNQQTQTHRAITIDFHICSGGTLIVLAAASTMPTKTTNAKSKGSYSNTAKPVPGTCSGVAVDNSAANGIIKATTTMAAFRYNRLIVF